jgi:beta-lactamase regulating signal transducer with metallopeptidase domain
MRTLLEMGLSNAVLATILALPVAAISRLCRRPALTHSLWLLVLLKLVTPPLVALPEGWLPSWQPSILPVDAVAAAGEADLQGESELAYVSAMNNEPGEDTLPSRQTTGTSDALDFVEDASGAESEPVLPADGSLEARNHETPTVRWSEILFAVWPAGSLMWFGWAVLHIRRFQRLLRHAQPGSPSVRAQIEDLARRMGIRRCPQIWMLPGAVSPMVWTAGGKPRLLFPKKLLDRLDQEQRATLLTHELAHIRRRDHWVRALEMIVSGLYWWHPVVWWARRELHEAEEQCCDAWVIDTLEDAGRAYALALLQTVAFFSKVRSTLPLTASGIGQVPHLRRRLTMIMNGATPRSLSWAGCLVVLGLGAMLLPLSAIHAQSAAPKEVDKSAPKDDREQQIEILKKAIKILEEQKKTDAKPAPKAGTGPSEEDLAAIKKLHRLAEELSSQIEGKRKELRDLEEKRKAILKDLGKFEGKAPTIELKLAGDEIKRAIDQGMREAGRATELMKSDMIKGALDADILKFKRTPEFDQKLERLLKDVEELKNEIRKEFPRSNKPETAPSRKPPEGRERRDPTDRSGATDNAPTPTARSIPATPAAPASPATPASPPSPATETTPRH